MRTFLVATPGRRVRPCPCPACLGEIRGRFRRMRHTLVDELAARSAGDGDLREVLALDLAVDTEARRTWARLGQ